MARSAKRLLIALLPLAVAACSNPVAPPDSSGRIAAPAAASADDVIVDSPTCRSGYNVTQGRCE